MANDLEDWVPVDEDEWEAYEPRRDEVGDPDVNAMFGMQPASAPEMFGPPAPDRIERDLIAADLPGFYQSPERMRAASMSGAGPYDAGTGLTTALGEATGMFPSAQEAEQAARQREVDAIIAGKARQAGVEDVPFGLKAKTATHDALKRAGQVPYEAASFLNTITGFNHLMDAIGVPSPSGGKSWASDEQKFLEHMNQENQRMSQASETIYGENAPAWRLAEGSIQALAELPAQMVGGAAIKGGQSAKVAASAAFSGLMGAGRRLAQDRGEGRGEYEALPGAIASGAITAITTKAFGATGAESIFRKEGVKGLWNRIKSTALDAGAEGIEEGSDEFQQVFLDLMDKNPNLSVKDAVERVLTSLAIGTIVGGTVGGARQALGALGERSQNAQQPQQETTQDGGQLPEATVSTEGTTVPAEGAEGVLRPQSEAKPTYKTPLNDAEQEEAHQLLRAEREGKLSLEDARRLQQLKDIDASGLTSEERDILAEIAEETGREADIKADLTGDDPLSRATAMPNRSTGKIDINPSELRAVMDGMSSDEKRTYLRSMFGEEAIHFAAIGLEEEGNRVAEEFINNATGLEKFLAGWRYTGRMSGKTIHGDTVSRRNLGHEMLRLHIQKLNGMTPTEVTMNVRSGRLTVQSIVAAERAIFQMRKLLGTKANKKQIAVLDAVQAKLNIAKRAAGMEVNLGDEEDESPASIRIPGDASPALNTFMQEFIKDEAKITNDSKAEGAVTTKGTGMGLRSISDLDALVSIRENLQEKILAARSEAMKDPKKMAAYATIAGRGQWLREVAEFATDTGSWQEANRRKDLEEAAPNRPLDWKKNPDVKRWIAQNGQKLGIALPSQEPASMRRSGHRAEVENNSKLAEQLVETITNAETPEEARQRHKDLTDRIRRYEGQLLNLANRAKKGSLYLDENGELSFNARLFLDMNPAIQEWLLPSVQRLRDAKAQAYQALNAYEGAAEVDQMAELSDEQINQDIIQLSNRSATGLTEDEQKQMATLRKERDRRFEEYTKNTGDEPFSVRRGGMTKKAAEIAEQKRRIAEMFAKSRGEELPEELKSKGGPATGSFVNPVAEEERVGPEAGGVTRPTPIEIEDRAKSILGGDIKGRFRAKKGEKLEKEVAEVEAKEAETGRRAVGEEGVQTGKVVYDRPNFEKFANAVGWDMTHEELFPIWERAVWKHLLGASAERLTQWRKGLGLEGKLGTREIMEEVKGENEEAARKLAQKRTEATIDRMEKKAEELEAQAKKASNKGEAEAGGLFAGSVTASGDAMARAQAIRSRVSQLRYMMRSGATVPGLGGGLPAAKQEGIPGLPQPRDKQGKRPAPGATTGLAARRYRSTVMSHIGRALLQESAPRRVVYDRDSVGIDDIDFSNEKNSFGAYADITRDDVDSRDAEGNPDVLLAILRDQARGSSLDPESASKRAVAVTDKSGKVYLVTTYNDAGVQRITDPIGGTSKMKPSRVLDDAFLNQYRPFAAVLLTDPVKGLHQKFDSVADFNEQIGTEASNRSAVGEYEAVPEGPAPDDFEVDVPDSGQGGTGIEGEGGSFMGPGKQLVAESSRGKNPLEAKGDLRSDEVENLLTVLRSHFETGTPENADDIVEAISGLTDRAKNKKMTPRDRVAIVALNKMFRQMQSSKPDSSVEETVDFIAGEIYDVATGVEGKANQAARLIRFFTDEEVEPRREEVGIKNLPTQLQRPRGGEGQRFTRVEPKKPGEAPGITGKMGTGQVEVRGERGDFFTPTQKKAAYKPYGEMSPADTIKYNQQIAENNKLVIQAKQLQESMLREKGVKLSWNAAAKAVGLETFGQGPASIRRAISKISPGKSIKRLIENTGSSYDEWMVDRIERNGGVVAEQMAPVFRKMIDRAKQLYGTLAIELDAAKAMAGGTRQRRIIGQTPSREALKASKWLHGLQPIKGATFGATSNSVGAVEGTILVPPFAQRVVDAAKAVNLKIGQMLESVVPGYQSTGEFVSNLTPFGIKLLKGGQTKMWKHWSMELAAENGSSVRAAQRALSKLKNDLASARTPADLKQANLDFVTAMPAPVLAFDYNGKTFKMARNFQASGKFARNITAMAYDAILKGSGYKMVSGKREGEANIWDKWTLALAKANNKPPEEVREFFRDFKRMLDQDSPSSSDIERVNQDFTRVFPKVVTHVLHNGQWNAVVHSDLFNYLENAAQRASHIRAFREQVPNNARGVQVMKTINEDLKDEMGPQGKDALNALLRTMQGVPTDNYSSWGAFSPTEKLGQAYRAFNATAGNVAAKLALSAQLAVQPGELATGATPMFLGYQNYFRGISKLGHTYNEMEQQGMVNKVMHDFSYDPNSPIRSSFRIAGNTISKAFAEQFFNEVQEALAASTAKVVADRIVGNQLDKWEKRMLPETFKAMGFNADEVAGLMQGDAELLGQFQRKAAAFLTGGNKAISEGSKIGANRLFNSIFRFQSYPMMKMNQFRKVATSFAAAWDNGTAIEKRRATEQMGRFIAGSLAQGAITAALTTLVFSGTQGLKIKKEEAEDEPLEFLAEMFMATVGGPTYVLYKAMRSKGVMGAPDALTRMIFPYTVAREMVEFGSGSGRYKDKDMSGRIGEFIKAKIPGTRAITTGLAMAGLSDNDQKLDASIDGFYRWRREKGWKEVRSFGEDDKNRKAFRVQLKKALEALKDGDEEAYLEAYANAAEQLAENNMEDLERGKKPSEGDVGSKIMRGKLLKDKDGRELSQDELSELRERIGDDAVDRLEWHDLMIERAADGVLLPRFDEAN